MNYKRPCQNRLTVAPPPYMPRSVPAPTGTVFTLFGENPIRSGVYVESPLAQEPDECHTEFLRHIDREAARGGDGAHDGHARREALLQDLEAAAPAHRHDVVA